MSILIGAALMILTYSLPTERVVQNVCDGLPLYEREGTYPSWALGEHSKLDNFTDAIMLLEVTHPIKSTVDSAMLNPRFGLRQDEEPVDALIKVLRGDTTGLHEIIYPRYWHGYLVVIKPLLMVMHVNHLRMLLAYADFILFVAALMMFQKVLGGMHALAFAAAVMVLNLVSVSMSFQFSSIYIVTLTAQRRPLHLFFCGNRNNRCVHRFFDLPDFFRRLAADCFLSSQPPRTSEKKSRARFEIDDGTFDFLGRRLRGHVVGQMACRANFDGA